MEKDNYKKAKEEILNRIRKTLPVTQNSIELTATIITIAGLAFDSGWIACGKVILNAIDMNPLNIK